MSKYVFDTDVLINFFNKRTAELDLVAKFIQENRQLAISTLSLTELLTGWTDEQAARHMPKLKDGFQIQGVSVEIATLAGKLRRDYKSNGRLLPTIDTLIAATALSLKATLITNNTKDFPIPGLKLAPPA